MRFARFVPWFMDQMHARHLKPNFWNEIRNCHLGVGVPWVIYGDFNLIFSPWDKSNGCLNLDDIRLAQMLIRNLHLVGPLSFGKWFTWTNGQANSIWVKLDRFLVNLDWTSLFPKATQNYLPRLGSDHVPVRLESGDHSSVCVHFTLNGHGVWRNIF